jgi:hypothetical protein
MRLFNRSIKSALASLMLAALCFCFGVDESKAQCPSNVPPLANPPSIPGWTGPNSTSLTNACGTFTVYYCDRWINNWPVTGTVTHQIFISGIQDNTGCEPLAYDMSIADEQLQILLAGGSVPGCSGGYTPIHVETVSPSCWQLVQTSPKRWTPYGISGHTGCDDVTFCIMKADMCYSFGQVHLANETWVTEAYDSNNNSWTLADATCPDAPAVADWTVDGLCYHVACGAKP